MFSLPVLSLGLQACFDSWRSLQQTMLLQILQILHDPGLAVPGCTLIVHWMSLDQQNRLVVLARGDSPAFNNFGQSGGSHRFLVDRIFHVIAATVLLIANLENYRLTIGCFQPERPMTRVSLVSRVVDRDINGSYFGYSVRKTILAKWHNPNRYRQPHLRSSIDTNH